MSPTGDALDGAALHAHLWPLVDRGHVVLLVLDSCYAGEILRTPGMGGPPLIKAPPGLDHEDGGGFIILASSIPSQPSREVGNQGTFTRAFLDAFRGFADADSDGRVTLGELKEFLPDRVTELLRDGQKFPGIAWNEQDCRCYSAKGIPDTFAIGRSADPMARPEPIRPERYADLVRPHGLTEKPVGLWAAVWDVTTADGRAVTGPDGQPQREAFLIRFAEDNTYEAVFRDASGPGEPSRGRYTFVPHGTTPPKTFQSMLYDGTFTLEYANGRDVLDARRPADARGDDIEIRVKMLTHLTPTLRLRRVTGRAGAAPAGAPASVPPASPTGPAAPAPIAGTPPPPPDAIAPPAPIAGAPAPPPPLPDTIIPPAPRPR